MSSPVCLPPSVFICISSSVSPHPSVLTHLSSPVLLCCFVPRAASEGDGVHGRRKQTVSGHPTERRRHQRPSSSLHNEEPRYQRIIVQGAATHGRGLLVVTVFLPPFVVITATRRQRSVWSISMENCVRVSGARTRASIAVSSFDHSNPFKPGAVTSDPIPLGRVSSGLLGPLNLHMYRYRTICRAARPAITWFCLLTPLPLWQPRPFRLFCRELLQHLRHRGRRAGARDCQSAVNE